MRTENGDPDRVLSRMGKLGVKDAHAPDIVGAIGVNPLRRAVVDLDLGLSAVVAELREPEDALALERQAQRNVTGPSALSGQNGCSGAGARSAAGGSGGRGACGSFWYQ